MRDDWVIGHPALARRVCRAHLAPSKGLREREHKLQLFTGTKASPSPARGQGN